MIRVLVIGKFPPAQGGIAAKTWHLARALGKKGVQFFFIGKKYPVRYSTPMPGLANPAAETCVVPDKAVPWFLPGGDGDAELLLSAALKAAEDFCPHIIEANYLVPYALPASWAARVLKLPLLLRHAGSDVAKFFHNPYLNTALARIIEDADAVATPQDEKLSRGFHDKLKARWRHVPRYVPDPQIFRPEDGRKKKTSILLYVGKSNFHWKLRALELAAKGVSLVDDWKLVLVTGGLGMEEMRSSLSRLLPAEKLSIKGFVSPDEMPVLLRSASAVWGCEDVESSIYDVSNVKWEAAACGVPVLSSKDLLIPKSERFLSGSLIRVGKSAGEVASALKRVDSMRAHNDPQFQEMLSLSYKHYITSQLGLYQSLSGGGDG